MATTNLHRNYTSLTDAIGGGPALRLKVVSQARQDVFWPALHGLAWSQASDMVAAYATFGSGLIRVWDRSGSLVREYRRRGVAEGESLAFLSEGNLLVTAPDVGYSDAATVALAHLDTPSPLVNVAGLLDTKDWRAAAASKFVASASQRYLAVIVARFRTPSVLIVRTKTWERVAQVEQLGAPELLDPIEVAPPVRTG